MSSSPYEGYYMVATEETCEAEDRMGYAAAALADRDRELPTEIVHAARTCVSFLNPEDYETSAGYHLSPVEVHHGHGRTAGIVELKFREEGAPRRASKEVG